jgi:hypothetical protein
LLAVRRSGFSPSAPIPVAATKIEEGSSVAGDLATRFFRNMPSLRKLCVMAAVVAKA